MDEESADHWIERLDDTPAEEIIHNMVPGLFMEQLNPLLRDGSWESLSADGDELRLRVSGLTDLSDDLEKRRQHWLEYMDNPKETKARIHAAYPELLFESVSPAHGAIA